MRGHCVAWLESASVRSQLYLMVTQILFHMTITDFSMGAKAFRRQSILPILDYIDSWTAYVFEICTWLIKNKKTVLQIGVQLGQQSFNFHFNFEFGLAQTIVHGDDGFRLHKHSLFRL